MYGYVVVVTVLVVMVTVNQITELTNLTEDNLPTLTTLDCHGNALTNAKNIMIPTLRKLYLVSIKMSRSVQYNKYCRLAIKLLH